MTEISLLTRVAFSHIANDVVAEMRRQVEVEGYTPEHDDAHPFGELARAGAAYALYQTFAMTSREELGLWPWSEPLKPKPTRRSLEVAAALICREIARLDRVGKE